MSRPTNAADLHRLAAEAKRRGVQIFVEEGTDAYFATSTTSPDRLYRVTGFSCTCKGFLTHARCVHFAALLDELGWLPPRDDDDPDPVTPTPAVVPPIAEGAPVEPVLASVTLLRPSTAPVVDVIPQEPAAAPVAPLAPITLTTPEDRATTMQGLIDGAVERLATQLEQGYTREFRELLTFYAQFHSYSWANSLLIKSQCPHASTVAGLRKWEQLGYRVRRGEKAIWVWAPIIKRVEDEQTGDKVERLVGFKPAPVFDASQLANVDEMPLPQPFRALPDDVAQLYREIRDRIVQSGIVVEETRLPAGTMGVSKGGLIQIAAGADSRHRVLAIIHELCHEIGHRSGEGQAATREQKELEAESVSFIVGEVLGVENPFSADYIANWQGSAEQLRASLGRIQGLVKQVLRIVRPDSAKERVAA